MKAPQFDQSLYHGGNGPLFSLILSMLRSSDKEVISSAMFGELIRDWGRGFALQMPLSGQLEEDLDSLASLLHSIGLVRVFEPHPEQSEDGALQLLVMRCLLSRYVDSARVKDGAVRMRVLPLLVDGFLQGAGHHLHVEEAKGVSLRPDEYLLILRETPLPQSEATLSGDPMERQHEDDASQDGEFS